MRNFPVATVGFLLSMALAAYGIGQKPKARIELDVRSVNVDAAVLDTTGKPVTSLTQKDFIIYDDGEPRQIDAFAATAIPFHTLMVFDCRSLETAEALLYHSVGPNQYSRVITKPKNSTLNPGDKVLQTEKSSMMIFAASRFAEKLETTTHLAIAVTDERGIRLIHDWDRTSAEIEIRSACDDRSLGLLLASTFESKGEPKKMKVQLPSQRLIPSEPTMSTRELRAYNPAFDERMNEPLVAKTVSSVEEKIRGTGGRKAVVWFGPVFDFDGISPSHEYGFKTRDWRVDIDFQAALRMVSNRSAAYFPVSAHETRKLIPPEMEYTVDNEEQRIKRLEKLAQASAGRVVYGEKPEAVDSLADQLNREIGTTYSLSFTSPGSALNDRNHKIEVKVRNSKLTVLQSRAGYFLNEN